MNNFSTSILAVVAVFALLVLMIIGMCVIIYVSKQLKKLVEYTKNIKFFNSYLKFNKNVINKYYLLYTFIF
jgi:hypothetical protein